jgi:hypothetical protein
MAVASFDLASKIEPLFVTVGARQLRRICSRMRVLLRGRREGQRNSLAAPLTCDDIIPLSGIVGVPHGFLLLLARSKRRKVRESNHESVRRPTCPHIREPRLRFKEFGGFPNTTKPDSSKWRISRSASILDIISAASLMRLRPWTAPAVTCLRGTNHKFTRLGSSEVRPSKRATGAKNVRHKPSGKYNQPRPAAERFCDYSSPWRTGIQHP